jgi:hypothetical protein
MQQSPHARVLTRLKCGERKLLYPHGFNKSERIKFEATLFLEINATQASAKSDLKQAIGLILHPFAPESIAREVVNYLNESSGPLVGQFEKHFYEKNKLKTTSVVSYAVKQVVNACARCGN